MERKRLPGLTAETFVTDTDRRAREALDRLPLLPKLVQKFYEVGLDRWLYCWNMAMSVRCGPKQYATLHNILEDCCHILDMPVPELYVTNNPFPNAFAGGVERPYITLRSSIVDTMNDEQLYHLIGHELGHIKAGHVLYLSIGAVLMPLLELLGRRTLGVGDAVHVALVLAFMEWSRQAEISSDRAGLLCSQDFQLSASANLMMCAGPSRLRHEANTDSFLDQSRAYQDISGLDVIGKFLIFLLYSARATHPMPVHRTQNLEKWHASGEFDRIMSTGVPMAKTTV